ncbi:MAG: TolC family protein [Treponema sp.]|nr:TolC family protein [Treponema sp.]
MNNFYKKGVFFLLFAFLVSFSFAEDKAEEILVINLEESVKLAKQNNIDIQTANNTLKDLKTSNMFSWNSISPTASITGSASQDFENDSKSIAVTGKVSMGLKTNLYTDIQGAKLQYEKGKITYSQAVRSVELNVRKSFYNLLYQQEYLELQKQNLATAKEQYEQNQEKFKNGKISELDALTSRVNYESKKPTVESAEITLQNDLATFKQILGIEQSKKIKLSGSLDDVLEISTISFESLPKSEVPAPNVASAEYDVKLAKNSLLDSRFSAYSPSVSASYSYGKSSVYDSDSVDTSNSLSLSVSIPLDGYLPWSSNGISISSKKNALDSAEKKLEDTKTTVAVQTESYIRKINQAISVLESLKATYNLAEQTYKMNLTAYNYGKTDLLSLQSASDSVLSAGVNLKSQAYTLISSILDLENLLGLEFGTVGK